MDGMIDSLELSNTKNWRKKCSQEEGFPQQFAGCRPDNGTRSINENFHVQLEAKQEKVLTFTTKDHGGILVLPLMSLYEAHIASRKKISNRETTFLTECMEEDI